MRDSWLTLAGVLVAGGTVLAQAPNAAPNPSGGSATLPAVTLDPTHNRLDYLLLRWQTEMNRVQTLEAQVARMTKDKTFGDTTVMVGSARYIKPDVAYLRLDNSARPGSFEQFIWSGNNLYEYRPADKLLRVHPLPPRPQGQVADDGFLSFIFGMKAEEVKKRYDLRLHKDDDNFIYIYIYPRLPGDKADFQRAELVLNAKTMMPRRLWFEQPNKNEITWDLPRVTTGVALDAKPFLNPPTPAGWRREVAPKLMDTPQGNQVQPRVIRPQR